MKRENLIKLNRLIGRIESLGLITADEHASRWIMDCAEQLEAIYDDEGGDQATGVATNDTRGTGAGV